MSGHALPKEQADALNAMGLALSRWRRAQARFGDRDAEPARVVVVELAKAVRATGAEAVLTGYEREEIKQATGDKTWLKKK